MSVFKKVIIFLLLGFLLLLFSYLIYPKGTVHYSPGGGSWIPFGASVSVSRCYGISKGITNKWLEEYQKTNGKPSFILRDKDYCIGTFIPNGYTVITSYGVDLEALK